MHVIGIDPGLGGAVAILPEERIVDTPVTQIGTRRSYLPVEMALILAPYKGERAMVVLEQQTAMPRQSPNSMFSIGQGFGIWLGILAAFRIPTQVIRPQRWKQEMLSGIGTKDKGAAIKRAQELFPGMSHLLQRVKDHDRAEALLMAEYGRQHLVK